MGRIPGSHIVYFLFIAVLTLAGSAAQAQAPTEFLQIEAGRARTWTSGGRAIVALDAQVTIKTDQARLYAQQAIIWFDAVPGSPNLQSAEVALIGDAKIEQSTGTRSGSRLLVNMPVRGAIRITAQQRLAVDASDSDLFKQAEQLRMEATMPATQEENPLRPRPTQRQDAPLLPGPLDQRPVNQRPRSDAAPDLSDPFAQAATTQPYILGATTRPSSPINFQAKEIETRVGPDGKMLVLLNGGVTVLSTRENGDFIELTAQKAVLFSTLGEAQGIDQIDQIRRVQEAVSAAYLEGDVQVIYTPTIKGVADQRLEAERVYYEFTTDRAVLTDAVIHTYDPQRGIPIVVRANIIRQLAVGEYSTEKVELTTSTFAVPSYSVRAQQAYVRQYDTGDSRYGNRTVFNAKDATFNAFGVPFFWLPRAGGSMTDRGSALRDVQFGGASGFGPSIRTRWGLFETLGQVAPQGLDASYRLDYFGDRGPGAGFDFDYTGGFITDVSKQPWNFEGSFNSYIVLDHGEDRLGKDRARIEPEDEFRYRLMYEHQHFFPGDWQIQIRAGAVSDPTFMEEWFEQVFDNGLPTNVSGYVKRQRQTEAITALVEFQPSDIVTNAENLQEVQFDEFGIRRPVEVERLPEFGYRRIGDSWADDQLTFFSDNTLSGLRFNRSRGSLDEDLGFRRRSDGDRDSRFVGIPSYGQTGTPTEATYRADFRQQIDYPFHGENFNFTPFIVGRYTGYTESPDDDGSVNRLLAAVGFRMSTQFWKVDNSAQSKLFDVNRIRHIIEPQVQAFASISNEDRDDVYIYDESIDGISDIAAVQLALRQRWQTKRGGPGRWRSVDYMTFNVEANLFANQPDEYAFSNFGGPANNLQGISANGFRGLYFYSHPEASIPRNGVNTDFTWRLSDTTVLLSDFSYNLDEMDAATASVGVAARRDPRLSYFAGLRYIGEVNSTIASFAGDYKLTPKYSFSTALAFDLGDNGRNSYSVTVNRKFDRFFGTVTVFYDDQEDTSGIRFGIFPEGLGYGVDTAQFDSVFGN